MKSKGKKATKAARAQGWWTKKYKIVSQLMNSQSGMTSGQLWQGDAASIKKGLDRVFGNGALKFGVIEGNHQNPVTNLEEKCLSVTMVRIHRARGLALMDSRATPNVKSSQMIEEIALKPERSSKMVAVTNGDRSGVLRKRVNIIALFEELIARLDFFMFFVLDNAPFEWSSAAQLPKSFEKS